MNSIVLTADDFGQSEKANKNILHLVKLEKVQRVSVMVNGKISEKEVRKLIKSKVKLDIHLEIPQLVQILRLGSTGIRITNTPYRSIRFIFLYLTGQISTKKVAEEWEKQIKEFIKMFGKNPDGLNSHEHVHFFPPYLKIALGLCGRYEMGYIRFGKKSIIANQSLVGWILKILNRFTIYDLRFTNINSSDHLASLDWLGDFNKFLENSPNTTLELVCHPEREEEYEKIKASSV